MIFQPTRLASMLAIALTFGAVQAPAYANAGDKGDVTVELIELLVQTGVLKKEQADALLKRAQANALAKTTPPAADLGAALAQPGDVRVPYISPTVRKQIQQEVKAEMMEQARAENWAQPNTFPDWVSRITVEGDMRVRSESRLFDSRNSNEIIDFAAFNGKGPTATVVGNQQNPFDLPYLNTRQDRRNLWRYRARLGVKAAISDDWSAGVRLASGSDKSPVSTTDGLGDGMSKKQLWLDQAYIAYQPAKWASLAAGRAANPFLSTDTLFSEDLQFDGLSAKLSHDIGGGPVSVFGNFGAFALDYAKTPWSTETSSEGKSENKWLFGAQLGGKWKPNNEHTLTGALAYYSFQNIAGQRSSPCTLYSKSDVCDSDWSKPAFMQKGNTLFLLRNIQQWSTDPSKWNEWQYVGLASRFNLLDVNLSWDARLFDDMGLRVDGNYIRNLAYDKDDMIRRAGGLANIATNVAGSQSSGATDIESGPNAWMLQAAFGRGLKLENAKDWRVFAGYKYIQPDALPDGYNDSGFHLGGTNAKGYFLGASYSFVKNVYGQFSWSSSKEVYGAPQSIDMLRFDLNARF
ncbi:putative porin [Chromobacterium sp. IIBBL 290-4]|uniref:putative porin n=1 Tax=Chromobacterium sp. IIBBL 290-4 TaxID=2953890 RepID=UPI0020B82BC7|nr:putative porin [Chromobacterium sp. IIBBL 290-4]UTH74482.1 putative porin [Chromobacterium sp. IIBBL 290-4]